MTHREWHTPEEAPAREESWTPPASLSASVPSFGAASPSEGEASLWTAWYFRASPAQQQEALLRALQQGIVYAHQLTAPPSSAAPCRSFLSSLLNGQVTELGPLHPPALEFHDGELDPMQREAVARAVATPDVCLIQGLPGTGKSRVVAEILVQAAQRGERILFLAPTTAALDSVLERLSRHPAVCPIRCLTTEENLAHLPAAVACLTLPERLRIYQECTVPAARAAHAAACQKLDARLREQAHWSQLEKLADQYEQLAERLRSLTECRDGVAAAVECSPLSASHAAWERGEIEALEHVESQLAGLQAELDTIAGKQAQLDSEWEIIRPLAEAQREWRFWTGAWWRALGRNGLKEQVRELETRRAELHAARQRLEQELTARRRERTEIANRYAVEHRRLQDEEIARRHAELDKEIAAVTREQDSLKQQWQTVCALLSEAIPTEISRQAVAVGRATWERLREQDVQRVAAVEQWLQTVEEGVQTLPEKLARCANVIAATTAALPADPGAADPSLPPAFDLLVLEQSHQVPEPEFVAAVHRTRRWVLIGEPHDPEGFAPGSPSSQTLPARRWSPCRGFFQRLWQKLHTDPRRLPFAWMRRGEQLLCRLRPVAAEHAKWIETEPVVDRPDIELRILSVPRQTPRIVEILFPSCMDIGEAKQFLFQELEELAVQTHGWGLSWFETAEAVILEFSCSGDAETKVVALGMGVCERLARWPTDSGLDWHTCSLEFARAAGWTRPRAEEWVAERLGLRSTGRTVFLTTPYRLDPASVDASEKASRTSPRLPRTTRIKTKN
jgi:hypothetical protein